MKTRLDVIHEKENDNTYFSDKFVRIDCLVLDLSTNRNSGIVAYLSALFNG